MRNISAFCMMGTLYFFYYFTTRFFCNKLHLYKQQEADIDPFWSTNIENIENWTTRPLENDSTHSK